MRRIGPASGSSTLRLTRGDRALLATIGMNAIGNAALSGIDEGWGDVRDRGTYSSGTALRVLRRVGEGRWEEVGAIVERLPLDGPDSGEPYMLLEARPSTAESAQRQAARVRARTSGDPRIDR